MIEGILMEYSSFLDDEGLMTIFSEATSVINSRPLSVIDLNDPQSLEPLTPNHLLTMKSKVIPKSPCLSDMQSDQLYARKQWKRVQYLCDLFWYRWKGEIVNSYMSRSKWNRVRANVKVNDVVLVVDEQVHRSFWKLARVVAVLPSRDGLIRAASVKMADGKLLERPIQKLVHLLSPD